MTIRLNGLIVDKAVTLEELGLPYAQLLDIVDSDDYTTFFIKTHTGIETHFDLSSGRASEVIYFKC